MRSKKWPPREGNKQHKRSKQMFEMKSRKVYVAEVAPA
jgi:hypothetical protein